jgi:hypothetical protein
LKCMFCDHPAILYLKRFQGQRKAASYPVCANHSAVAWAYQEFGQDAVRDLVEWLMPVRRRSIPRFKVSLTP